MIVRTFLPDDAAILLDLFRTTVQRINSRDYSPDQVQAWAPDDVDLAAWAARFRGRFVVVAEIDREIAGFAEMESDGHLDRFFVSADHQKRGVGRALLQAIVDEARRLGIAQLFAEVSITARPFFETHKFVVLTSQDVVLRGIEFRNFRMARQLD